MSEPSTGSILPRFWDELRHLSLEARAVLAYLCTNRHNDGVAGLAVLSMATIADDLNVTPQKLQALWKELDEKAPGFVQVDVERRLVRIPKQPRAGHSPNHKVIRAWWRRWKMLPDCPMRTAHVLSLAASLKADCGEATRQAWEETFGTIDTSTVDERLANGSAMVGEPLPNRTPTVSASASASAGASESESAGEGAERERVTLGLPGIAPPRGKAKAASPLARWRTAAERLWALQEDLRRQVLPGARGLRPDDERLERIAARLEAGASEADCEHVLRVYALEADPKWFNGETHWRKGNFDRALGRTLPAAGAKRKLTPEEAARRAQELMAEEARQRAGGGQ
jgi:hypothetical protein